MMDKKVQMMDAGMAYFRSENSFGEVLGQTAAEMREVGNVLRVSDEDGGKFGKTVAPAELPESTAACDLFVDFSTPWRKRFISCLLESAGENMYAARFKQGDSNGWLKDASVAAAAVVSIAASILAGTCIPAVVVIILALVLWFWPSVRARRIVGKLIDKLNSTEI